MPCLAGYIQRCEMGPGKIMHNLKPQGVASGSTNLGNTEKRLGYGTLPEDDQQVFCHKEQRRDSIEIKKTSDEKGQIEYNLQLYLKALALPVFCVRCRKSNYVPR
jgi:hypothetical protein